MSTPTEPVRSEPPQQDKMASQDKLQAIAYSMDALVPGFYLWAGPLKLRLGGCKPEPNYPGTIHASAGIGIVLPGYRIFTTYRGSYDPGQA